MEFKNILPPQDIQNSTEKQMKDERDRRQAIRAVQQGLAGLATGIAESTK